jgi:hypothetical protein
VPDFVDCLTSRGREALAILCRNLGWDIKPRPRKPVEVQGRMETLDEIDRLMKEKPRTGRDDG